MMPPLKQAQREWKITSTSWSVQIQNTHFISNTHLLITNEQHIHWVFQVTCSQTAGSIIPLLIRGTCFPPLRTTQNTGTEDAEGAGTEDLDVSNTVSLSLQAVHIKDSKLTRAAPPWPQTKLCSCAHSHRQTDRQTQGHNPN